MNVIKHLLMINIFILLILFTSIIHADELKLNLSQLDEKNEFIGNNFKGLILARNLGILGVEYNNSKNQVFVSTIKPESLADNSGIKENDIIWKVNDKRIQNVSEFNEILSNCNIEGNISVCIARNSFISKDLTQTGLQMSFHSYLEKICELTFTVIWRKGALVSRRCGEIDLEMRKHFPEIDKLFGINRDGFEKPTKDKFDNGSETVRRIYKFESKATWK